MILAWTPEQERLLPELIAEKLSASQIAARLGGKSRNAVIGKISRMGLQLFGKGGYVDRAGRPRTPRVPKPSPVRIKAFQPPKLSEQIKVALQGVAPVEPLGLPFAQLEYGMCRYPYGDGPFTFCCHPVVAGQPYCGPHYVLCNTRPTGEKRAETEIRKRAHARAARAA